MGDVTPRRAGACFLPFPSCRRRCCSAGGLEQVVKGLPFCLTRQHLNPGDHIYNSGYMRALDVSSAATTAWTSYPVPSVVSLGRFTRSNMPATYIGLAHSNTNVRPATLHFREEFCGRHLTLANIMGFPRLLICRSREYHNSDARALTLLSGPQKQSRVACRRRLTIFPRHTGQRSPTPMAALGQVILAGVGCIWRTRVAHRSRSADGITNGDRPDAMH